VLKNATNTIISMLQASFGCNGKNLSQAYGVAAAEDPQDRPLYLCVIPSSGRTG
jgi:hypothetical protein